MNMNEPFSNGPRLMQLCNVIWRNMLIIRLLERIASNKFSAGPFLNLGVFLLELTKKNDFKHSL